jgi:glucose-1-phosphate thymidylyltransferase
MRPMTYTSAKQLLPVANKPVLFFALESVAAAGLKDVGIVTGETGPQVMRAVGDGSAFGLNVTYIPQAEPLGLAHAVLIARNWLAGDDFLMYLGDNFVGGGITQFVSHFESSRPAAHILLTRVADPRGFGVAELDATGRISALVEKPQFPKSDLALAGIYLFTPIVHEAISAIRPSWRDELEITDAVQWLVDAGYDVGHEIAAGPWKDTGTVADMLEVNRLVLASLPRRIDGDVDAASEIRGRVEISAGATVRNSKIIGPATITSGAQIDRSCVGPFTSIGADCRISGSEIEHSIVLPGTSIDGALRVVNSFIGRNVEITSPASDRGEYELVLGDYCRMRLGR